MHEGAAQNSHVDISCNNTGCKTIISSMKKGRFWIETAKTENSPSLKKAKLRVVESPNGETEALLTIISKQSAQIELLYDMLRNAMGNDRLFEKDFISELSKTYEMINELKKKINTKTI